MSSLLLLVAPLADPVARLAEPAAKRSTEGSKAGPIGLAVILILCVACYFLFKSMSKHLKKVRDEFPDDPPANVRRPGAARAAPPRATARSEAHGEVRGDALGEAQTDAAPPASPAGGTGSDDPADGGHGPAQTAD